MGLFAIPGFLPYNSVKNTVVDAIRHAGAGCGTSPAECVLLKSLRLGILRTAERPKLSCRGMDGGSRRQRCVEHHRPPGRQRG